MGGNLVDDLRDERDLLGLLGALAVVGQPVDEPLDADGTLIRAAFRVAPQQTAPGRSSIQAPVRP